MSATMKKIMFYFQPAFDLFLILFISIISITLRQTIQPVRRGFFCNDESLMHPYKDSTISSTLLYCVAFLLPSFSVALVEIVILLQIESKKRLRQEENNPGSGRQKILLKWLQIWFRILTVFFYGIAIVHFTTNIAKYSLGRLRPHFLAVCKPDYSKIDCSLNISTYIEDAHCTGVDEKKLLEARISFPSGHASMAIYTMVFTVMYLEKRFTWNGFILLKPFIQTWIFYLALYTCMTRIADYKHHWSDVLGGAIIGLVIAILMAYKVSELFEEKKVCDKKFKGKDIDKDSEKTSEVTTVL